MRNAKQIIPVDTWLRALAGTDPPRLDVDGRPKAISYTELGAELAKHRRGSKAGRPYSKGMVDIAIHHPEKQGRDLIEAFWSWRREQVTKQAGIQLLVNDLDLHGLLGEQGHVEKVGSGPVQVVIAVAELPARTLLQVGELVQPVECTADLGHCQCGTWFVKRSWNQVRCFACRQKATAQKSTGG